MLPWRRHRDLNRTTAGARRQLVKVRATRNLAAVAACAIVSFAVGIADYRGQDRFATPAELPPQAKAHTGDVYFQGHWGWQYIWRKAASRHDTNSFRFKTGISSSRQQVTSSKYPGGMRMASATEFPTTHWLTVMSRRTARGSIRASSARFPTSLVTCRPILRNSSRRPRIRTTGFVGC